MTSPGYDIEVLADSPVGYWKLEETTGTTAVDASGNGRDGVYKGSISLGAATIDGSPCPLFDGINDSVSLPSLPISGDFTFEAWAWSDNPISSHYAVMGASNSSSVKAWMSSTSLAGPYTPAGGCYSTSWQHVSGGLWTALAQHLVYTQASGGAAKLYVNGVLVGSTSITSATGTIWDIGAARGGTQFFWKGTIGRVAIYPTALSAARVDAHWTASLHPPEPPASPDHTSKWHTDAVSFGATHIYSDDGNSFTVDTAGSLDMWRIGTAPVLTDGPRGRAGWAFDGNQSLYHAPDLGYPQDEPMSIETWVRVDHANATLMAASTLRSLTDYEVAVHQMGAGVAEVGTPLPSAAGQVSGHRADRGILSRKGMNDGQWHQLVMTASTSGGVRYYVDGILDVTRAYYAATGTAGLRIAANGRIPGSEIQRWTGDISSVAVYPRALTAGEVWILWGPPRSGFHHVGLVRGARG